MNTLSKVGQSGQSTLIQYVDGIERFIRKYKLLYCDLKLLPSCLNMLASLVVRPPLFLKTWFKSFSQVD